MKHGVRYWCKKVGLPPNLKNALRSNLVTQLITFERLNLTKAKAEWVKQQVEELINTAKGPLDEKSMKYLLNNLEHSHLTLRKLCGPLVARYADRNDEYARIVRYGSRGQGSNQAELAYIELIDQKFDSKYALALYRADKLKALIKEYNDKYFDKKEIELKRSNTAYETPVVMYQFKPRITINERDVVSRKLRSLYKMLNNDSLSILSYNAARKAEADHAEIAKKEFEKQYEHDHKKLQDQVDKQLKIEGKISEEFKDKLILYRACLEDNKIVSLKTPQDIAFETGELPELYTVDRNNYRQRLNPERRTRYYLNPKFVQKNKNQKFSRTYMVKNIRFSLPRHSKDIPDRPSLGPPIKKKLTRKEFIDKYIDLATPKLIKKYEKLKKINNSTVKSIKST